MLFAFGPFAGEIADHGMDTLIEIRRLKREGKEDELQRPAASSVAQDEQTNEGGDLYARSRADPKDSKRRFASMGYGALQAVHADGPPYHLHTLEHQQRGDVHQHQTRRIYTLAPKYLSGKYFKANDFEEYNFKPKEYSLAEETYLFVSGRECEAPGREELLQMIAEMYVFVGKVDKEKAQQRI
ncbi:hypothetical protein AK812_SmicGene14428 [Symbiodinium microadriaticum]|uniref:Uncharacterized protein n=1 Tax=Symbiodinium microadriaticum TaxID=2951 RepID=A0A1Q9E5J4_SYMMI|nr:hypothetical protein AK812_SmicGene14428 [Symbiodinium microadriaticum]